MTSDTENNSLMNCSQTSMAQGDALFHLNVDKLVDSHDELYFYIDT